MIARGVPHAPCHPHGSSGGGGICPIAGPVGVRGRGTCPVPGLVGEGRVNLSSPRSSGRSPVQSQVHEGGTCLVPGPGEGVPVQCQVWLGGGVLLSSPWSGTPPWTDTLCVWAVIKLFVVSGTLHISGFPHNLENLEKWEYTWKTWNYHGILENLIKIIKKLSETWKNLASNKFLTFYFLPN